MTTKVRTTGYEETKQGIDDSLKRFNHDYFDLILIHWPMEDDFGTYRALEEAYQEGKTRAIGLSNFNVAQVQAIIDNFTVASTWPDRNPPTVAAKEDACLLD